MRNNILLNAERKSLESSKQTKNISRSEFYPSITITGDQTSTTSTNRTSQSGTSLSDTNLDSESKTISLEQVIFSGFKGINTFEKSEALRFAHTNTHTHTHTCTHTHTHLHRQPNDANLPLRKSW